MAVELKVPLTENPTEQTSEARVVWLNAQKRAADAVRRGWEAIWTTNILFLSGRQWEEAAEDVRRWGRQVTRPAQTKVKLQADLTYPRARQVVSSVVNNLPQSIAIATTTDHEDLEAAQLGTDLIQDRYHFDREAERRIHEGLWTMCCGRSMPLVYWDSDSDGRGVDGPLAGAGDIARDFANPFKFYVCPWSDMSEEPPYVIFSEVKDIDDINDIFKPTTPVKEEEYASATASLDKLLTNIVDGGGGGRARSRKKAAILNQMYAKPTAKYPKGALWIWCGDVLLHSTELPEGKMPGVFLDWWAIPGSAYPQSFMTPLIQLQKQINTVFSQSVEMTNRNLRLDTAVRGAGKVTYTVDPDTGAKTIHYPAESTQSEIVSYDPHLLEVQAQIDRLKSFVDDATAVHPPTMGETSGGTPTAFHIQALLNADLSGSSLFVSQFSRTYCKVDALKLLVAANHYDVRRLLNVVGEDMKPQTQAFFGSDLKDTRDVRTQSTPVITEVMKMQLRADAAAKGSKPLASHRTK
jgi:hypothetical protein